MRALIVRRPIVATFVALLAGVLLAALVWGLLGGAEATPTGAPTGIQAGPRPDATPTPSRTPAESAPAQQTVPNCGTPTTSVGTAAELATALGAAVAGDSIALLPGTYVGNFVASAAGTAAKPIELCGTAASVLDGDDVTDGYVFHLDHAQYWRLVGFTVTNGQKGVMADGSVGSVIQGLTVTHIGDEAVHLRQSSTDNQVIGNTISDTGNRNVKFGEGVYVGTAKSNWCDVNNCQPDASDRNLIEGNHISATTSESIDLKEGSSGGTVRGNTFDGSTIKGADSWVDVKGNGYLIENNSGTNSPEDGFQTHEIIDGWGTHNTFRGNSAAVNGPGFGYSLTPELDNVVECSNTATGAGKGVTNVTCTG